MATHKCVQIGACDVLSVTTFQPEPFMQAKGLTCCVLLYKGIYSFSAINPTNCVCKKNAFFVPPFALKNRSGPFLPPLYPLSQKGL